MAALVARAPTRLDFGGGWTDVPPYSDEQGGCVCSVAINLHAIARIVVDGDDDTAPTHSSDNALVEAAARRQGVHPNLVRVQAEYPLNSGLGGSSAAGVAVLGALSAWRGVPLQGAELAEESRRLEVEDLGVPGGRQDHYAAVMGGALGLWFGDGVLARRIPLTPSMTQALNSRCVVVYTGQSRISGDTITGVVDAYRARDRRVVGALDQMRDLANRMVTALEQSDIELLGRLVGEHWAHQRSLHPAIPTPLIDTLLAEARDAGAIGGKALGASGGGCVLAIAAEGREEDVRRAMGARAELLRVEVAPEGFRVTTEGAAATGIPPLP
jgi:D-glycero-alpha-D-manno-heptose-7-phosphate kinase